MGANLWGGSPLWEYRLGLIMRARTTTSRRQGRFREEWSDTPGYPIRHFCHGKASFCQRQYDCTFSEGYVDYKFWLIFNYEAEGIRLSSIFLRRVCLSNDDAMLTLWNGCVPFQWLASC